MEETKYLKEKLFNEKKNGWFRVSDETSDKIMQYADEYMYFLNRSKTEKEAYSTVKDILIKNGVHTRIRRERGADIGSACGQLRLKSAKDKK